MIYQIIVIAQCIARCISTQIGYYECVAYCLQAFNLNLCKQNAYEVNFLEV